MKKIITGLLGIAATIAVVGGVAYAVTFGHVEATATASTTNDLLVSGDGVNFSTTLDLSTNAFSNLTTVGNTKVLTFSNQTSAATTALTVQQVGTLVDSGDISDDILVAFGVGNVSTPSTSYFSLDDWAGGGSIPGAVVPAGGTQQITIFVKLGSSTQSNGNSSYSVSGINFDFGPTY